MVDATSKRALPDWYAGTAIQVIRPVAIEELNSERYCRKWDRVKEEDLEKIASLFFSRIKDIEKPESGCFLFDTTNYYTYMASDTPSELAKRGKNKEGRGLAAPSRRSVARGEGFATSAILQGIRGKPSRLETLWPHSPPRLSRP